MHACRLDHLEEDFPKLIELLNSKRPPSVPKLRNKLHSSNRGDLTKKLSSGPDAERKIALRHFQKYEDCGPRCFALAQQSYADDFRLLKYPTVQV